MADATPRKTPVVSGSPAAGCAIFVVGAVGILLLVVWFIYAGYRQSREIAEFTDERPRLASPAAPTPEALQSAQAKISSYSRAIAEAREASLTLNVEELNTLLAGDATLAPVKDMIRVESLTDSLRLTVSLPVKQFPRGQRFLNGIIEATPDMHDKKGVHLTANAITVPDRAVSEGFVRLYKQMDFIDDMLLKGYRGDPKSADVFKKTTSVKCSGGTLTLTYSPKK